MPNKELPASAASSTHSSSGSGSRSDAEAGGPPPEAADAEGGGSPPEAERPASNACGAPDIRRVFKICLTS